MTNRSSVTAAAELDPRNVFLTPTELFRRNRWGRTAGYQKVKEPGFPPTINGGYRLDTILAYEDGKLADAGWVPAGTPVREPAPAARAHANETAARMPPKKRPGRKAADRKVS